MLILFLLFSIITDNFYTWTQSCS